MYDELIELIIAMDGKHRLRYYTLDFRNVFSQFRT